MKYFINKSFKGGRKYRGEGGNKRKGLWHVITSEVPREERAQARRVKHRQGG
jgi:hypothetical protein